MDNSIVARTQNQLNLVKGLLSTFLEPSISPLIRERIAIALERIALVQGLMSTLSEELSELERQNEAFRRTVKASEDLGLQRREPQENRQKDALTISKTERYFAPDEGLIDSYRELAVKYGELRRETELMRANIEVATRLLGEFWVGDEETKTFLIEKFRLALSDKAK